MADKKQGKRSPFHYNQFMIDDFYKMYPEFYRAGRLEFCSCVYYPIADLELELLESSSEEFETIEHAILELIYGGIKTQGQISKMMGLPEKYVKKIIDVLESYGHLLDMQLTDLGEKSVLEGVKYTRYSTRQKVQADPLFGALLTKELVQPKGMLSSSNDTRGSVPLIQPDPYVEQQLLDNLRKDITPYRKGKKKVFHVNVIQIEEVISKKMKYAYGFLLQFEFLDEPIVVLRGKKEERTERVQDAFYWKPMAITKETERFLGLGEHDMVVASDERFSPFVQIKNDIMKQLAFFREKKYDFPIKVESMLQNDWGIDPNQVKYKVSGSEVRLLIEPHMFEKDDMDLQWFKSLSYYDVGGESKPYVRFSANHIYPGLVCYAETKNPAFKKLIANYQKTVTKEEDVPAFIQAYQRELAELVG
ncbi:hypothetical protein [Ornithinibacillus halophilus]|uniref:Uncharacterized protein n=1 Tax=Ornithinibacillus halophilus TaxID=930117 RepID=A0A1M5GTL2_9BACI|nr:hypothetical protein [Ornithinibacillus halophilus]SHG07013.1 hypothetical protein SAMN05216225_101450 [Ornithinibacillus halophilus]